MPPTGQRLTPVQVQLLRTWIDQGAAWNETTLVESRKNHWAFQPVIRPTVPHTDFRDWASNPIDHFIAAKLAKSQLRPNAEADRPTLIRRLKFDLLGLPPTPEEVEAFVKDPDNRAYENLVDRYLASPHFGERWARHWLDVVRFAESAGFEMNSARPNAWPYRDYVIRAFNDDKPYDQFILDQLAGDAGAESEATGFLVAGAYDQVKGDPLLNAQQRADELHDMVSTTGSAFLGLTVGCARCHNHKFDPVSQVDYYSMKAILAGVQHGEREIRLGNKANRHKEAEKARKELANVRARLAKLELAGSHPRGPNLRIPVSPRKNIERFPAVQARFVRMTILETTANAEPCLDELEVYSAEEKPANVALASHGTKATASSTLPGYPIHQLVHLNDGRYGNNWSWISNERGRGWVQLEFSSPQRIDCIVWSRDRQATGFTDRLAVKYRIEAGETANTWRTVASSDDRQPWQAGAQISAVPAGLNAQQRAEYQALAVREKDLEAALRFMTGPALVYAGKFTTPEPTHRLHRGEINQKKEQVAPAAPSEFGSRMVLPLDAPEQQRRLALARWMAEPSNPLTARVMVNRLWQHHFGMGIVSTPSDFGLNGARPSHPELLDWLACEFVAGGWRMKSIHRLIVLSSTYRQASSTNSRAQAIDAGARLLWRYPARRLEAEPLRDAILFVSGKLDLGMGGPGFDLFEPNNNYVKLYTPKKVQGPAEWRRMIYQSKPRMRLDDVFGAFDCPDAGQTAPTRTSSTTALQVFNLLNSPFMLQQAGFFAQRLEQETGKDMSAQVRRAFWLAYQRPPDHNEQTESENMVRRHGLKVFCLALFNANEFLYVY